MSKIRVSRVSVIVLAIILTIIFFTSSAFSMANSDKNTPPQKRIVVFSLPRLTWEALQKGNTPHIDSLISQGSVAAFSVKSLGIPAPEKSYASLSAGMRATAPDKSSTNFLNPEERTGGQSAATIYANQRGKIPFKNPAALGLGFEAVLRVNAKSLNGAKVGLFSTVLTDHKKSVAVFGNADSCVTDSSSCDERSVAYFGSDVNGVVRYGEITRDLLKPTAGSVTQQLAMDNKVMSSSAQKSLKEHDVTVVECSDLERVDSQRTQTKQDISDNNFKKALSQCDDLIGDVMSHMSLSQDQMYVISPIAPRASDQTTIFIAAGKDIPKGYASSATTRVKGIVSIVDIAPTILESLNVPRPETMGDTLIEWKKSSQSNSQRESFLKNINDYAIARDNNVQEAAWFIAIFFVITALISLIAFSRKGKWNSVAKYFCYSTISMPLVTYLLQPAMVLINKPMRYIVTLAIISFIFGAILMLISSRWGIIKAMLCFMALNLAILFIDIVFGGRLQADSIFGNATIVAGRFAGWGNSTFAFVGICTLVSIAMLKEMTKHFDAKSTKKINALIIALLCIVIVLDGAPYFGSDVGGVLALTPTAIIIGMFLYDKRVGLKTVLIAFFATVGTITVAALVDLARPTSERTHLGRFAQSLIEGHAWTTIERKMNASIESFHRPELYVIVLVSIALIVFMFVNREKIFARMMRVYPGVKYLLVPGLVLGVLGTLLNDSGLSIPARMLVIAIPVIIILSVQALDANDEKVDETV